MKTPKANAGLGVGWLQLATYPQSPFSGPVGCCDVTDLYQAFSQRTSPGRLWISLSARFVARFGYPPRPKIDTRYFTPANNPKTCNLQPQSVTYVLNLLCYLCSDCAPQSPNGEWRTVNGERVNRRIDDEDDEHEQEVKAPNIDTYF